MQSDPTNNSEQLDLRSLISAIRRQYKLLLLTLACTLGLALVYLFQATPLYTATTLVFVDPRTKNLLEENQLQSSSTVADNARLESEVIILRSPVVLLSTIQNAGLVADPEFGPSLSFFSKLKIAIGLEAVEQADSEQLLAATMRRLSEAVQVRRQGLTHVLNVSVTSRSPQRAALLANTLTKTYIDLQIKAKVELALGSRDLLQAQLQTAQQGLSESEDNLDRFIQENIDRITQETGDANINRLGEMVVSLNARRLNAESLQSVLDTAFQSSDWTALSQSLQSDALAQLEAERAAVEARLSQVQDDNQAVEDIESQLLALDERLQQTAQDAISTFRTDIGQLAVQTSDLRKKLRTNVLTADLSSQTLTALYGFQQEADIAQRQYITLLSRMRDLEAQALVQLADSRIVSEALPPTSTSYPNTRLVLAAAMVVGLGFGFGLAFLSEFYIGGITSSSQLANVLPVPVAAIVPMVPTMRDSNSVSDNIKLQPLSAFAESFRKLRAAIEQNQFGKQKGCFVIMVTSAVPGEGKTSIAMSLARTYAMAGKRVLLIDADLRKPSVHKHLQVPPTNKLLDYLVSDEHGAAIQGIVLTDPVSKAWVIAGGGRPEQATDQLVQSEAFARMIELAKERADVIIIDTSPLVPVVDPRYVVPFANAVLLVVRFSSTSQSDLRYAYDQVASAIQPGAQVYTVLSINEQQGSSYRYAGYYEAYTQG